MVRALPSAAKKASSSTTNTSHIIKRTLAKGAPPVALRLYRHQVQTPLGPFAVATDSDGAVRYCNWVKDEPTTLEAIKQRWYKGTTLHLTEAAAAAAMPGSEAAAALQDFFNAPPQTPPFELQALLDTVLIVYPPTAPAFMQAVWETLRSSVPAGQFISYGDLGDRTTCEGKRNSAAASKSGTARAVGQAMARNPIVVVMPCHRVLAASQGLNGYGCGLNKKVWMLRHESAKVPAEKLKRVELETKVITKVSRA